MVDVDLEALRKAHGDGKRTKTFSAAGHEFEVPSKVPLYVAAYFAEGELVQALRLWLGDEQEAVFRREVNPTEEDFRLLMSELYGIDLGNSDASAAS